MGSPVQRPSASRESDELILTVLDEKLSGDLTSAEIRKKHGLSNGALQGMVWRILNAPQPDCHCKKPRNKDGGMPRRWWTA